MSSDRQHPCQRHASGATTQAIEFAKDYFWRARQVGCLLPRRRQILPGIYPGLTIITHGSGMRILGTNATARVGTSSGPRRAASGGFSIAEADTPKSTAPAASLRTIGGIDALIALQGQDDPAERRQRAVKRGRTALDALDELKVEVLSGTLGPPTLARLKSATAELRDTSGDPRLDTVLAEIELRLEVEIAKIGAPR
jgi:hypothetical protein